MRFEYIEDSSYLNYNFNLNKINTTQSFELFLSKVPFVKKKKKSLWRTVKKQVLEGNWTKNLTFTKTNVLEYQGSNMIW